MKKIGDFIKKHKKAVIIIVIVAVIAIIIAVMVHKTKKKAEELMGQMTQETYVLEKRNLVKSVSGTGKIASVEKKDIIVSSLSNVKVAEVNVKLGDAVKEGDIICTFDTEDIERNLANAKTDLAIAQKKTANSMDNQSRGLYNTQLDAVNDTNRNLEELDKAQRIYDTAKGEKAEASRVFDEVYDVYEDYYDEDEYYDLQEELQKVKKRLEDYSTPDTSSQLAEFNEAKVDLMVFLNQNNIATQGNALEKIEAGGYISDTPTAQFVDVNDASYTGASSSDQQAIDQKAERLKNANDSYISAADQGDYNELVEKKNALSNKISNMETAKSKMESAKSSTDSAKKSLDSAADSLTDAQRKQEDNYRKDVNGVKDAENNYDSAKLDASVASRDFEDKVRKYEEMLEEATLRAPFAGIITAVNYEPGDNYNGQTVVTLEDLSSYVIEAGIDEYDISKVKVGQQVKFKTNATGDEELEAEVIQIAPRATAAAASSASSSGATTTSGTASYLVKMKITSDSKDLRLDMTAKINIIVDEADDVYAVPFSAVQTDENGNTYIEVEDTVVDASAASAGEEVAEGDAPADIPDAGKGKKPLFGGKNAPDMQGQMPGMTPTRRINVTTGVETDYYVEIKSPELSDGLTVIVFGSEGNGMDNLMMMMGPAGGL
ncbi:MAG: efflux RND transporter periplasmic adaptor subunit [Lachnospiraceae bacterium]|nr:efflux RND transporter periplasmic adaptor subunit [Lachnospiraceae bacterium]